MMLNYAEPFLEWSLKFDLCPSGGNSIGLVVFRPFRPPLMLLGNPFKGHT